MKQEQVRCIDTKTGRVFFLSRRSASNVAFMRKYGYRIEDVKGIADETPDVKKIVRRKKA